MQQWVIAKTHIFCTLLSEGKLVSQSTIQHYLAYTVKVMALSSKYDWKSILIYDNEFRKIQAIYNFPCSFNSTHLHTVMLQPIFRANSPTARTKPPQLIHVLRLLLLHLMAGLFAVILMGQGGLCYITAIPCMYVITKWPGRHVVYHTLGSHTKPLTLDYLSATTQLQFLAY